MKAIKEALKDVSSICERCKLRLAGIKNSRIHLAVSSAGMSVDEQGKEEDGEEEAAPAVKRQRLLPSPSPCRVCLGILEDGVMHAELDRVSGDVRHCGYDADHFTVAISLPISLALREHSIKEYLGRKMGDAFDEDEVVPLKQVWKWIFPMKMEAAVGKRYVTGDACQFYIELKIEYDKDEEELKCLRAMCEAEYAMREKKSNQFHMGLVTRQGAEKSLASVATNKFEAHYPVPPGIPERPFSSSVSMNHDSIFIAGRYNKYSRHLPQTPWLVDGERKAESSVEELILSEIRRHFEFEEARFSSSGREDVDVRMLGRGRPFTFEVTNPRRTRFSAAEMAALTERINASTGKRVRVRDLQVVEKSSVKTLKEGEDQKVKTYTALCVCPGGLGDFAALRDRIDSLQEVEVTQKTPIRVLHRRSNMARKRTIYSMTAAICPQASGEEESKMFKLKLATQAGTYVKEFVHGDFRRTRPNLRELLGRDIDIVALDVESIELDWPPSLEKETANGAAPT